MPVVVLRYICASHQEARCRDTVHSSHKNGHHFAGDIFGCIFVNEKFCILIIISLKFVPKGPLTMTQHWGPDDDLAPNRWQSVIWTNVDPIHWCIYTALGGYELSCLFFWTFLRSALAWNKICLIIWNYRNSRLDLTKSFGIFSVYRPMKLSNPLTHN